MFETLREPTKEESFWQEDGVLDWRVFGWYNGWASGFGIQYSEDRRNGPLW